MNLGILLAQRGDNDGARAAYQRAIDSGDGEMAPRAALALGTMAAQDGDAAAARAALQKAIDSGHPEAMPWAAYNLGVLLAGQDDFELPRRHSSSLPRAATQRQPARRPRS